MFLTANRGCTGMHEGMHGVHASLALLARRGCTGMHGSIDVHPMHPQSGDARDKTVKNSRWSKSGWWVGLSGWRLV